MEIEQMMEAIPTIVNNNNNSNIKNNNNNNNNNSSNNNISDVILMEDILIVDDRHESTLTTEEISSRRSSSTSSLSKILAQSQNDISCKYIFNDNISLTSLYDHVTAMSSNESLSRTSPDSQMSGTLPGERKKRASDIEVLYESGSEDETFYDASPTHLASRRNSSRCISPELDIVDELIKVNILEKMKKEENEAVDLDDEVVLLAGDSVLNEIDADTLSDKYKVEKVPFSQCSIGEIITGLTPQLASNPKYVILHLGNNENTTRSFESILEDLTLLKSYVMKCLPTAYVLTCYPMARNEPKSPGTPDHKKLQNKIMLKADSDSEKHRSNPYICATKEELLNILAEKDDQIASLSKSKTSKNHTPKGADESKITKEDWTISMYVGSFKELKVDAALDQAEDVQLVSKKLREVFNLRMRNTLQCCNRKITELKQEYESEVNRLKTDHLVENTHYDLDEYMGKLDEELRKLKAKSSSLDENDTDLSDPSAYVFSETKKSSSSSSEGSMTNEDFAEGDNESIDCSLQSTETLSDIEQSVIVRVKESIAKMFKKSDDSDGKDDELSVHFKLEALEDILEENYSKITDMTDKLNEKWSALEEEMRQDFTNTLQKKEEEHGRKTDKMVYDARVKMLRSISALFVQLAHHHTGILNDTFLSSNAHSEEDSGIDLITANGDPNDSAENRRLKDYSEKLSDIWKDFIDEENSSRCELEPINEKMELRYFIEKNFDTIIGHMASVVKEKYESFEQSKAQLGVQFKRQLDEERERRQKDRHEQERELENIREENEKVTQECEVLIGQLRREHKDEVERLKKEHRAQQINSNKLHKDELENINKEHEDEIEEMAERHKEEVQEISELNELKIQGIVEQHREDLQGLAEQRKNEIQGIAEQHREQLEEIIEQQKEKIEEIVGEHKEQLEELKEQHNEQMGELTEHHEEQLEELREQHKELVEKLKEQHKEQLEDMKAQHAKEIQDLTTQHKAKLAELTLQHEATLSEHSMSMGSAVKAEHIGKLRSLQQQYEDDHAEQVEKLSVCRSEHRAAMEQLKKDHDALVKKLHKDHADALKHLREEHTENAEKLHQENTEKMENLKNTLQSEKMVLLDEVTQLEEQTQSLQADMTLKSEELKEMTKLKENAESLLQLKESYIEEVEERMQYTQAMSQHTNDLLDDVRARLQKERDQHALIYENLREEKNQENEEELQRVKCKMEGVISKQLGDMERLEKEKKDQDVKIVEQQFRVNELEAELWEKNEISTGVKQNTEGGEDKKDEILGDDVDVMKKLVANLKAMETLLLEKDDSKKGVVGELFKEMNEQIAMIQRRVQDERREMENLKELNNNHIQLKKILREKEGQLLEQIENQEAELDSMKGQLIKEKRKQMDIRRSPNLKDDPEFADGQYSSELASSRGSNPDDYRSDEEGYPDLPDSANRHNLEKDLFIVELETARSELLTDLKRELNKLTKKNSVLEREANRKAEKVFNMRGYIKRQKNFIAELKSKLPDAEITENICKVSERLDECDPFAHDTSEMTDDAMSSITEVSEMEMTDDEENDDGEEGKDLCDEIPDKRCLGSNADNVSSKDTKNSSLKENALDTNPKSPMTVILQEPLNLSNEPLSILNQPMSVEQMERMLEEETTRRNEITNFLKRQESVLSHLEVQIGALKTKLTEKEEQFNVVKEDFVRQKKKSTEKSKNGASISTSTTTTTATTATATEETDPKDDDSLEDTEETDTLESNSPHMEALTKLQKDFATATEERKQQISILERSMSDQVNQTGELKDILKRQQIMVCELSQQLNKQKCITTLHKKEMGEVKESMTMHTGEDIPVLRKELDEVKERSLAMESLLQTHIKKNGEKHEAMNTVRRLKQKLLTIEHKMMNDEQEGERVTELVKREEKKNQNIKKVEKPEKNNQKKAEGAIDGKNGEGQSSREDVDALKQAWLHEKEVLLSIIEDMKKDQKKRASRSALLERSESSSNEKTPKTSTSSIDSSDSSCTSDIVSSVDIVNRRDDGKDARVQEHRISSEFKMYIGKSSKLKKMQDDEKGCMKVDKKESIMSSNQQNNVRTVKDSKRTLKIPDECPENEQTSKESDSPDLERGQRLKTSLLESYTIVSQLDTFLTNEKKKIELINSKFESDSTEQSAKCSATMFPGENDHEQSEEMKLNDLPISVSTGNKLAAKVKCLKAWELELKKREESLVEKEERLKTTMNGIEQGCDLLPQKEEKTLNQSHNDKALKHHTDTNLKKLSKLSSIGSLPCIPTDSLDSEQTSTTDGQKLVTSGWTQTKVQRLYLKYFRAETFRKNLAYQKQYLTTTLYNQETDIAMACQDDDSKTEKKLTFRTVVLAIISIRRMKYLALKYHRNLNKCSLENPLKDRVVKKCEYLSLEEDVSCSNESANNSVKVSSGLRSTNGGSRGSQPPPKFLHVLV